MLIRNEFNGYGGDGCRLYFKGGDGGAGDARRQEQERQTRVKEAVDRINGIFDSKPTLGGVNAATSYDPNQTYYNADGSAWTAPPATGGVAGMAGGITGMVGRVAGEDAVRRGLLYTGVSKTPQTTNRQQLYDQQKAAVYDINALDVNKQYKEAERQNRFGLARNGLLGGSADVDSNAQLQEKTNEGLMKATGIGDQAASDLKLADERSRQSLISMAQSGIDTGTAQGMALRNLDATAQSAQGARQGATIGGLFNDLSQAYLLRQAAAGQRAGAAAMQGQQMYPSLSTRTGDSGTVIRG